MKTYCLVPSQFDSVTFDNCRMTILNAGGDILHQFNLDSLVVAKKGTFIDLYDGMSHYPLKDDDATALGITVADITDAIAACKSGGGSGNVTTGIASYTSGPQTLTAATYNSISIYVHAGTVEVDGVVIPTGVTVGWSAPNGAVINDSVSLTNFTGATVIVTTTTPV